MTGGRSGRASLGAEIRTRAPEEPGVYFFRDEKGAILYIGKAVDLRKRLLSHLRPASRDEGTRHAQLVHAIRDFTCEVVPSELQALVREDELIKLHRPPFNVRQNDFPEYKYLERTDDLYPRFRLVDHAPELEARTVFGPYPDVYKAEKLLLLLQRVFGVRACRTPEPVDRCLEFDLCHCPGPCRQRVDAEDYASGIRNAESFLRGEGSEAEVRIRRAMEAAAARLEFEKAHELKEQLLFCRRFCERERFLTDFRERRLTVVEGDRTHVFLRGRGVEEAVSPGVESLRSAISGDGSGDRRMVHDRGNVVYGWVRRNRGRCRYWFDE